MNINTIAGPIIGGVIGYFTNYIAVKMLFRPLYPIKVGKYTLPFTPGIIPKRKNELAQALGTAVGNTLITQEDLEKVLLSNGMKQSVTDGIIEYVINKSDTTVTIKESLNYCIQENDYEEGKKQLEQLVCEKIVAALSSIDLGTIIANECGAAVKEKVQGTMVAMLVNDKMIASITGPIGERVKDFLQDHGVEKIQPVVIEEIEKFENQPINELLKKLPFNETQIREQAYRIYAECITSKSNEIIKQFNIAGIVKNKIHNMPVEDIEKLVLSVMKTELDAVVNLGAIIGLIIGLLNLLF